MIYKQEEFSDGTNAIIALTPIDGSGPSKFFVNLVHSIKLSNGKTAQVQRRQEIMESTIENAFHSLGKVMAESRAEAARAVDDEMRKRLMADIAGTNGQSLRMNRA